MESLNNILVPHFSFSTSKEMQAMSEQGLQYPQCVSCSAIRITREGGFSANCTLLTKGQVTPKQHHLLEFTSALCFLLQSRRF